MAAISNRGGRWQARVRSKAYPTVCKTFHRRSDAVQWAKAIEIQQQRGTYRPSTSVSGESFGTLLNRYRERITPTKRSSVSEGFTIGRIYDEVRDLRERRLQEVRASDIAALRDRWLSQKLAPATVTRRLGILGHLFEVARREWSVEGLHNPVREIRMPRISNARARVVADEEVGRILSASESEQLPALVTLLAETAMRRGEAIGLRAAQVDWTRSIARLEITKNGRPRDVALSPRAIAFLRDLKPQDDGRYFTFSATTASGAWRRAARRALETYQDECTLTGRPIDPGFLVNANLHDLRHSRLSKLAAAGFGVVELMAVGGHRTLSQLQRYTHIQTAHLVRKLAALEAVPDSAEAAHDIKEAMHGAKVALDDAVEALRVSSADLDSMHVVQDQATA